MRKKVVDYADVKMDIGPKSWFVFKFFVYGFLGMTVEIVFTNVVRLITLIMPFLDPLFKSFKQIVIYHGHIDPFGFPPESLFAYTSVWMFFVYGLGLFAIEILYKLISRIEINFFKKHQWWFLFIRLAAYSIAIFITEFATGWIIFGILKLIEIIGLIDQAYLVWEYTDSANFFKTTTFLILPFWLVASFFAEIVIKKMCEKDVEVSIRTNWDVLSGDKKRLHRLFLKQLFEIKETTENERKIRELK